MNQTLHHSQAQTRALERVRKLAWLLDRSLKVPGTQIKFGLDGLIGLIPGIGDGASALLGGAIIAQSFQFKLPLIVRVKMLGNLVVDALIGVVPILGDLLDVGFQANQRNAQLLLDSLEQKEKSPPPIGQKLAGGVVIITTVLLLLGLMILPFWLVAKLF
ncbi:MAG: DUF4112 domain-containing protein [Lysobacterales bacterium]